MLKSATFNDAPQAALGFLTSQVSHIEKTVWEHVYPEITYPELVPVTHEADEWAKTVTYYSSNKRGKADWVGGRGRDIPMSGIDMEQHETGVHMAGAGYDYSLEEINQARKLGINLPNMGALAARRAYEEMVEDNAYVGNTDKGFEGLFNTAGVTIVNAPNGAASTPEWSTKIADEILADFNTIISGAWTNSLGIEMCDTVLIPLAQYALIATKRLSVDSETTILDYVMKKNMYTVKTGKKLTVRAMHQLAGAGGSSADRCVAYQRNPTVVTMHVPMQLKFLAPQQIGLVFEIPGIFRLGGVDIRRPGAFRYLDDI